MLAFWIQFAKTMHFIGLISWMAGIFYMPRLLVYLREAQTQEEPTKSILSQHLAQYAERLYKIIMQPAMIITFAAGISMIFLYGYDWFAANLWLHFKFMPLMAMAWFHTACFKILRDLKDDKCNLTATQLRYFNEIPTILLLAIVMLAVFKNSLNLLYAFVVLVIFSLLLVVGVRLYKKARQK